MAKLKILVADRSVINRKFVRDTINSTDHGIVVCTASNGEIAVEWLNQCDIDVILLDLHLIREGGTSLIKYMKSEFPDIEIIIMSDKDPESAAITLDSLNSGALDFIMKPIEKDMEKWGMSLRNELEAIFVQIKVKHYSPQNKGALNRETVPDTAEDKDSIRKKQNKRIWGSIDLVLIASSTGGPVALDTLCRLLPADFNKTVMVIQHMPPGFTKILAETLNHKYKHTVIEGKTGDIIKERQIIIAPGGFHMIMDDHDKKGKTIKLIETAFMNGVRPSADVLFCSVAAMHKGKNILAVVLTGMGNDGTKGIMALKEACNCYCITQSETTCVAYGMPKCVYDAGLSDEVVNLNDIAIRIYQITNSRGWVIE